MTFFNRENVEDVSLVTDLLLVNEMRGRLAWYVNRPTSWFPANWPTSLSQDHVSQLESQRYVVTLKPDGWRYLLYVDADGRVFFENRLQYFFLMDPGHAVKLMSLDGRVLTDTVLDDCPKTNFCVWVFKPRQFFPFQRLIVFCTLLNHKLVHRARRH